MTSSRTRLIRAAAPVALAGAMLAGYAAPATAAPPAIRILRVSSESVPSGGTVQVRFQATNNNQRTEKVFVAVSGGLRCTAGCAAAPDLGPGKSRTFEATVVAPKVGPGQESGRNLAVSVRIGTQTAFDHKMIIVRGGNTPPSSAAVSRVTGRVRDADGKAITGASLTVRDSAGHEYRTTSDGKGRFSVKASDSKPIAAGSITVVADKDGYRAARATVPGTARGVTVRLVLAALPTPTRTSPSPTAAQSTPAAEKPAPKASLAGVVPEAAGTAHDDGSGSLMFTLLGGLLVAAGLGTLVLMVIRRRRRPADPDPQATQVMAAPVGGGLADAPTAVLRAVPPHNPSRGPAR
ncbi:carboxypeptidase-like regulatory domain-containing protein [Actinoplanes sp. NPDC048967]|uniref:carboxypeptidase-like regulatory domain-containing protein n=1 Tax=Actinoplanes sp. NPDC048967 TaxID=3155269 RepID=UPI0033F9EB91